MSIEKKILFFIFIVGCITFFTNAADNSHVVVLTNDTFATFIQENPLVLVEFYAPWCTHCKKLEPEYEAAAQDLKAQNKSVVLAKVDADSEKDLTVKYEVRGYPTLAFFRNGIKEEYSGGRVAGEIVAWLDKMTGDSVAIVEDADAEIKKNNTKVAYVGHYTSKDTAEYKTFEAVASAMRSTGKFLAVIGSKKPHGSVVARIYDEETEFNESSHDMEVLKAWVEKESFPLFGPINGDNFKTYVDREQDIIWICGDKDSFEQYKSPVKEVARSLKSRFSFVWLDTEEFKGHAEGALGVSTFPALVYQSKDGRYVLPDAAESLNSAEKISNFFKSVDEGKIEKTLKSAEIPETNDEAVKVVVGKTFTEIVLESNKDVLLEVYAPWCGHCKQLEPIYKELAERLAKYDDKIIIAKMDGTENEPTVEHFEWTGFPSIFFVKAGSKIPLKYEGGRTADDMMNFVKDNASFQLDPVEHGDEL